MADSPDRSPEDAVARLLDYQRAIIAFARLAAEARAPERLMHHLTAQVARLTHVGRVKVLRYRPDDGDLLIEAGVGWKPGVVGRATLGIDRRSPAGRALQTGSPVTIENLPDNKDYRYSDVLREHGIVSVSNVPVFVEGRTWGVLEVDHDEPRKFDDGDVGFLATVATILGTALQRCETERKIAEMAEAHRQEKTHADVLLRELQHRIRNNFQTILSFLSLQRRHADADSRERFGSVMDRVRAIALAHDQLSMEVGGSSVEFDSYLHSLCANIDPHRDEITILVEARAITLPLDRAVPAGLIVNELVMNALKHAFGGGGGTISVTFTTDADMSEGCIIVEDDGSGMGPPREGAHGLSLVAAFAQQLQGRLKLDPVDKGTRTTVIFPLAF